MGDVAQNSYASAHNLKDDGSTDTPILADSLGHVRPDGVVAGFNVFFVDGHGIWNSTAPTLKERLDADYGESPQPKVTMALNVNKKQENIRPSFRILTGGLVMVFLLGCAWAFQRNRGKKPTEPQEESSGSESLERTG